MKYLAALVVLVLALGYANAQASHSTRHHTPMQRFIHAVQEERVSQGLNLLTPSRSLNRAAEEYATELCHSQILVHDDLNVGSWRIVGENIGRQGGTTIQNLIRAFEDSPGHYANIIHPLYTHIGFGQCKDHTGQRWVVYRFAG